MKRIPVLVAAWGLLAWCGGTAIAADEAPTHKEVESIGTSGAGKIGTLATLCVAPGDRLLACDAASSEVKVFDIQGALKATWKLPFAAWSICPVADGAIYVGGDGKLARLDKDGKVLKAVDVAGELIGADGTGQNRFPGGRPPVGRASGMAVTDQDVFVSFGSGWSMRAKAVIVRFDRDLTAATKIADGLNGCCQRLDLVAKDGWLYVAENARHRVLKMDRDGKVLASWGKRARTELDGFGSCCNPMNLWFGADGMLYTAESGLGRVKRYTPDGKLLSFVGEVGVTRFERAGGLAASCSNVAVAASADGSRVFVQDVKTNGIRVLAK